MTATRASLSVPHPSPGSAGREATSYLSYVSLATDRATRTGTTLPQGGIRTVPSTRKLQISLAGPDDITNGLRDDIGTASFRTSCVSLCKTILGSALLAMPAAFMQCGLLLGAVLISAGAFAAAFGLRLLCDCRRYAKGGHATYSTLAQASYPAAATVIDAALVLKCFGVATSYLMVIGDLMPFAVGHLFQVDPTSMAAGREFWITLFMFVVTPLAFLKHLSALKYFSIAGLGSVLYLAILVVWRLKESISEGRAATNDIVWVRMDSGTLAALPVIVFAFTCHQNIFALSSELHSPTKQRLASIINLSVCICHACYLVIGLAGYLTFGSATTYNILINYQADDEAANVARVAVVVLATASYPLQTHPLRVSVLNLMAPRKAGATPETDTLHVWITAGTCALSYAVAMMVSDLGLVFGLIGATGSTTLCYLLPGLFYMKLQPPRPHWTPNHIGACALVVGGVLIMILANGMVLVRAFQSGTGEATLH